MSDNHIEFVYGEEGTPDEEIRPIPAQEDIPDWFMRTPAIFDPGSKTGTTLKLCRAFTDALHMGFLIPAPEDITIHRFSDFSIGTETDRVHVYGPTPHRDDGNSMYPMPEVKIDNPWRINTPDGYSTLITKPTNRAFKGFEPNSILIPTDTYDGPINIPAVMGPRPHEIKKGEPLAHAIPFKRDEVLNHKNKPESEVPELVERCHKIRQQLDSRKDLYRKVYHQEKPTGEVVDADEADVTPLSESRDPSEGHVDATEGLGKRSETHDESFLFISKDKNYGVTPGPYDAIEKAPPWIGELEDTLETDPESDVNDERLFDEWIRAACSMGAVDVIPADVHINQAGEYAEREATSRFDKTLARPSMDEKIGPEFPFEMKIAGVNSDRFVASADGYSTLMTDPLNHYSQHVRGFQGVVDHDVYYDVSNMPSMFYTQNPEFVLEQDSPHLQAISFRRDSMITKAVITY